MKSELCIFDLTRGATTVILATDTLIEAPNWSADDRLLLNGDGRLYFVDLADPALEELNTDFAVACNNDHGISPDGTTIVISDSTEFGASCIYTLPMTGGRPVLVTKDTPSYWHGWSPDGQKLAYVARREGRPFEVYTVGARGGSETRLTDGFDHTDGPDYSPDGRWIWFNGERGGRMQLWRMHPDGSDLQQMTDDARANWFPHPSPDGQQVVYLSYPSGTQGHPRDKDVELHLMPAEGGPSKPVLSLFGGQGTINVPSWSPDSTRFAFVRYTRP